MDPDWKGNGTALDEIYLSNLHFLKCLGIQSFAPSESSHLHLSDLKNAANVRREFWLQFIFCPKTCFQKLSPIFPANFIKFRCKLGWNLTKCCVWRRKRNLRQEDSIVKYNSKIQKKGERENRTTYQILWHCRFCRNFSDWHKLLKIWSAKIFDMR